MPSERPDEVAAAEGEPNDIIPPSGRFKTVVAAATKLSAKMNGTRSEPAHRLQLFEGPIITGPDGPVKLSPRQAQLLSLVYGHETRPLSRRRAIWLLWEKDDNKEARHSLREVLYKIKERLGFRAILTPDQESLVPDLSAMSSDLVGFRRWVGEGRPASAAGLLLRGFLSGLRTLPGAEFEDWAEAKRLRLRHDLRTAAAKLWDEAHAASSWARCLEASETLYSLYPDSEAAVQKIVEARAMTGSPEAAETAYSIFLEQLGSTARPSRKIVQLMERVRLLQETIDASPAARLEWEEPAFCGREMPLSQLLEAVSVGEDCVSLSLVEGEAGMGKSRLLREFAAACHLSGATCLFSQCSDLESKVPLGPLIDYLTLPSAVVAISKLEDPWRAVLTSVAPQIGGPDRGYKPPGHLPVERLTRRLLEAFLRFFQSLSLKRSLVLLVDDFHWSDETTLTVLRYVVTRWRGGRLHLVCSCRPEELIHRPATRRFLQDCADIGSTIALAPLPRESAEKILSSLWSDLEDREIDALASLSGGVPFYLVELAHEFSKGRLSVEGEIDTLAPLPIRQIVERRLEWAPETATSVLAALAVAQMPLGLDELGAVTRQPAEEVAVILEALGEHRLVRVTPAQQFGISHQIIANAVYAATATPIRVLMHRRVAQVLGGRGAAQGEAALHYWLGGAPDRALALATDAARLARTTGALPEAIQFLQLAKRSSRDPRRTASLHCELGGIFYELRNLREAAVEFEQADKLLATSPLPLASQVQLLDTQSMLGHLTSEGAAETLRDLRRQAITSHEWATAARSLDVELHVHDRSGNLPGIHRTLKEAETLVSCTDEIARCMAHSTLSLHVHYGSVQKGLRSARQGLEIAVEHALAGELPQSINRLLIALTHQGLLGSTEGRATVQLARSTAGRSGDLLTMFSLAVNQGVWNLDTGNLDQAEVAFHEAHQLVDSSAAPHEELTLLVNQGELSLAQSEYGRARDYFRTARALVGPGTRHYVDELITAGTGLAALRRGDLGEARSCEERLAEDPVDWFYDPTLVVQFRVAMLERRGQASDALRYLEDLLPRIRERFVPTWIKLGLLQVLVGRRLHRTPIILGRELLSLATQLGFHQRVVALERILPN